MKTVIFYIAGQYLPITETWIYSQLKTLTEYQPIVYCHGTANLDIYPTENVRPLNCTFFNLVWNKIFKFYPLFIFYLLKDKPDLIHAHFGLSGYEFLKLKQMFKIPLITSFYGQDLSMLPVQFPKWKKRYNKLFANGEIFLIEGNHMKKCLMKLGCPEKKIIVQHLGVDLNKIKFSTRKLGTSQAIKILISASFREKKGIPYAVKAVGIVKKGFPKIKIKLTIIGDSTGDKESETEKRKILDIIEKYNLKGITKLLGFQPHKVFLKELYQHHIFLSPSITASTGDTEGGAPVSIIEASASGMPVVSTFHCDIPEIIIDNISGYLVEERNSAKLTEKLLKLIYNTGSWVKMAKAGRNHIEENYNIKKQIIKLETVYDSLRGN